MTYRNLRLCLRKELMHEAEMIICKYGGITPAQLMISDDEVADTVLRQIQNAVQLRKNGQPLQYILGECGFYNLTLYCEKNVLIPRFDTEILVEEAINRLPHGSVFADICCGSGCIACAVLYNRPDLTAICVDISDSALELTQKNLNRYNLSNRAKIIKKDITKAWDGFPHFDAVLSNPPYIETKLIATLSAEVQNEPRLALDGGENGLDFYRAIIKRATEHFPGIGHILFETGYDQAEALKELSKEAGMSCEIIKDRAGLDRAAVLKINKRL